MTDNAELDEIDRRIINGLQGGFPICPSPYAAVARNMGIAEDELLRRLQRLRTDGLLSRFGPMYHAEKLGGALTLAAISVPEDRYEAVAELVNAHDEVAHNYAREHQLNMWFVLATEQLSRIDEVIAEIEAETGLIVYNMPKKEEYFIGLRFEA
jgi:DNA-binding Lrp family transcriptional regulator